MSRRYWNSYAERSNALRMVNSTCEAILHDSNSVSSMSSDDFSTDDDMDISSVEDTSDDDDDDDDSTITAKYRHTVSYLHTVYGAVEEDDIDWGKSMLISDISDSEAIAERIKS